MRVNEHLLAIELPFTFGGIPGHLFIPVVLHEDAGVTLVDTGVPGSLEAIERELGSVGRSIRDVRAVVLTHHDLDHIGSLADVVQASGARVYADRREVPFIDGNRPPQKHLAPDPRFGPAAPARVDEVLQPGQVLPVAGGLRAVPTPGHTFGHTSFLLERSGVLLPGDSLALDGGVLHGPPPHVTPDLREAHRSVRVMSKLPVRAVLCYHGGLLTTTAAEQLRGLADQLDPR